MADKRINIDNDDYELNLKSKDNKSSKPKKKKEIDNIDESIDKEKVKIDKNKKIPKNDEEKEKKIEEKEETNNEQLEKIEVEEKEIKIKESKVNSIDITKLMILSISIFGFIFYIYYLINCTNTVNYFQNIINASIIVIIFELLCSLTFLKKKSKEIMSIIASSLVIIFLIFNIFIKANIFKSPKLAVLKDYTSASIINVINDCNKNKIDLNKTYEYSDNIKEGNIISQSVLPNTLIKEIDELTVVISNGPNYDKTVMLTDFVGLSVNEVIKFIEKNKLSNVSINFDASFDIQKDLVISQSTKGEIKRNTEITFNISLGSLDSLKDIKMNDLKGKSLFDATLYLKRNGIKYEIKYEFSSDLKKNHVITQNKKKDELIKPLKDVVILTISLGKEIKVPDFTGKTSDNVLEWIVKNNLKVEFTEKYDVNIEVGGLIGINYKKGDSISEGTKINIITSLGPVVIPNFKSLGEFRNWAQLNNINFTETYVYNDTVAKGGIVKLSIASGQKIDPTKSSIEVTVSQGKAVIVPYLVGKSKSQIQTLCRNIGLNCTFYYTGFSNIAGEHATRQSVYSGAKVVSGTYVSVGLSNGQPQTFSVYIQSEWFQSSANDSINVFKNMLSQKAPGVYFNYIIKKSNTGFSGQIHEQSPVKGGPNTFVQGRTYTIYITQ